VMFAAKNLKHHRYTKGPPARVAPKLKYHRLKPGGVHGCPIVDVVMKLKYHRLKPGGVHGCPLVDVALKLKYHRLKPGGVHEVSARRCSYEVEVPPAKARWCPKQPTFAFLHRFNCSYASPNFSFRERYSG